MKFIIADSYEDMSRKAADLLVACVKEDPHCTLGLATGTTPIGLYACMVDDCKSGKVSFSGVTTFNLDEYIGLDGSHIQSYRYFMNDNLFNHVDIDIASTHLPDGSAADPEAECVFYEQAIENNGGVDIQLLGLGNNGHIGFNEPCGYFPVQTHVVDLDERTIQANSRLFDSIDDVPRCALTMGIGTIMKARKIVVVVNGQGKADIVKTAFMGPVVPEVPASILQLHPDVVVVLDPEAASQLNLS